MPGQGWWVDDVDLAGCAFAIQNRSAGWFMPARRGQNYIVPGRDGAVFNANKPLEENLLTLTMFAAGADANGVMPADASARILVRQNLDTLSRLFGKSGLREMVYSETDDYNRINLLPNPSAENAGEQIVIRENVINNPSGEVSGGDIVVRRNFADNPGQEEASRDRAFRTNYAPNPRMADESDPTVLLRNWVPNPSLEAGPRFWRAQVNSKISTNRKTRTGGSWPAQGQQSLRAVAVANGNCSVEATSIEVAGSTAHTFSGYVWNRCEADRTIRMFVRWFAADGTFISKTSDVDTVVVVEGTARLVQANVTSPSNARTAAIRFVLVSAEQDDVFYIDGAMATRTTTLKDYFDGDTDEVDGTRYRWTDEGARSISEQYIVQPRGWYSPTSHRISASTDFARRGSQSLKLTLTGAAATNDVLVRQTVHGGCAIDENQWVAGSIAARLGGDDQAYTVTNKALTSNVATLTIGTHTLAVNDTVVVAGVDSTFNGTFVLTAVTSTTISYAKTASNVSSQAASGTVDQFQSIKVNLHCFDSKGTFLGVVQDITAVDVPDVSLGLAAGNWQTVTFEAGKTVAGTAKVCLAVKTGQAWNVDDVVYLDTALVENAQRVGEWFDGNVPDDDVFGYEWTDEAHWSASEQRGSVILGWEALEGRQYQSATAFLREYSLLLQPYRQPASAERPRVISQALDARPGRLHRLSAYVNTTRSFSIQLGYSIDGGTTWTYGGATSPTINTWTRLSFGFTLASTVDPEQVWIAIATNAAPADGDQVFIDSVLFEPCEPLRDYFDGDSGVRFDWTDDPNRSISVKTQDRADGWQGYGSAYPITRRVAATGTNGTRVVRSVASQAGDMGVTFAQDGIDADFDYSFAIDLKPSTTRNGYVAIVWLDSEGTQVGISQSSTTSLVSSGFTRKTITGSVPAGASVGVPIAVVVSAVADEWLDADGAVFGFGASTDYKDGDSGSGWRWTGEPGFSESEQIGVGVDYWLSNQGTLARNSSWSTNRTYNGTYTVTNAAANAWVAWRRNGNDDERRFKLTPTKQGQNFVTFAVDVRASQTCQVELRLLLSRWKSQGWAASTAPSNPIGSKIAFAANEVKRLVLTVDTATFDLGDATHFRPAAFIYDETGSTADLGDVVRFDSASLSRDEVSTYQDGTFEWVIWTGDVDASSSKRVGPARRIYGERIQAIDFTSLNGGVIAEFAAQLTCPDVFWEDTILKTQRLAIPRRGGTVLFDKFEGMTAPIQDAEIRVNGPINDFTITDVGSGTWFRYTERLRDDQTIVIDNANWTVKTAQGKSRITEIRHSGHSVLLPMTPRSDEEIPRLKIDADGIGRGAWIQVQGRRKYHVA